MIRKLLCLVLAVILTLPLPLTARAAKSDIAPYAEKLIRYYYHYQDAAEDVIWDILNQMKTVDPNQAAVWRNIMEDWAWVNSGMPVGTDVLPDGLPEDESLSIVVLGYALAEDGSMREELIDRLVVALASALKYPRASIVVTGGQTSEVKGVTEAGQMAAWLKKKGISEDRIIVENQSLSTTANAVNVYKLLNQNQPQVRSVAVITSDYHITWSSAMFAAVSNYKFGYEAGNPIDLVAAAACDTGSSMNSIALQAWGVSVITGIPFDENSAAPELYYVDRPVETVPPTTEPLPEETEAERHFWQPILQEPSAEESAAAVQEPEEEKTPVLPILLGAAAAVVLYVLMPKKPKKRNRRQRPKMDWSD